MGNAQEGGEIAFGGVNPARFTGDFVDAPLTSERYWQFKMDGMGFADGSARFCQGGCQVIADSGTSLLVGPKADVEKIMTTIGAKPLAAGEYTVDCSKISSLPDIDFTISGQKMTLTGEDYVLKVSAGGLQDILGDVFMGKFYTVFNKGEKKVSFAKSVQAYVLARSLWRFAGRSAS